MDVRVIHCSADVCLTAAQTPVTCPERGHVTADVDPRSGQGHVIFGGPLWPAVGAEQVDSQGHGGPTVSTAVNVGVEDCPWTLRALPGTIFHISNNLLRLVSVCSSTQKCSSKEICAAVLFSKMCGWQMDSMFL